jgi:type VI secretion system FHA domain protein
MGALLSLEVVSRHRRALGGRSRCSFGPAGGTIGRTPENTWELPDDTKLVSKKHAVISHRQGTFYIEDTSANGVFLNGSPQRLTPGRPRALRSRDRIALGPTSLDGATEPYEILVTIESAQVDDPRPLLDDPFAEPAPSSAPRGPLGDEAPSHGVVDPLVLIGHAPAPVPRRRGPSVNDVQGQSPLQDAVWVPNPVDDVASPIAAPSPIASIPAGYDPMADSAAPFMPEATPATPATPPVARPPVRPRRSVPDTPFPLDGDLLSDREPAPLPPAAPPPRTPSAERQTPPVGHAAHDETVPDAETVATAAPWLAPTVAETARETARRSTADAEPARTPAVTSPNDRDRLASVLSGAGLDGVEVSDELARDFGKILRLVVGGVMDLLNARQMIRDQFRIPGTQIRPAENNPISRSVNVDDALHNLLVKRNPAYLPPVDAFADAFDDVRAHQLAVLAGMRAAYESMLSQFDPASMRKQFERQMKKGGLMGALTEFRAEARYWELYCEKWETLSDDPDTSFRRLFGEEFARAYETQLGQLKAQRGKKDSAS